MTPINKLQKESIIKRLSFISEEVAYFSKFSSTTLKEYQTDRDKQRQIERSIEILLNAAIDVAKIFLSGENIKTPATYREAIQKLAAIGVIDNAVSAELENYVELRNILAHEYLDLRWVKIKNFIQAGPSLMQKYIDAVNNKI